MSNFRITLVLVLFFSLFSIVGCTRTSGNISVTDPNLVSQIKVGQTKEEVKKILGDPTSVHKSKVFDMWTYNCAQFHKGFASTSMESKGLLIKFDSNGIVEDISGSASDSTTSGVVL